MPRKHPLITFDTVRTFALELPGVEEGTSYGTPAFRARGKFFLRLREDGDTLVVKVDLDERDLLMNSDPETYYLTDHYRGYAVVLVRLSKVHREDLRERIDHAWRLCASKRMLDERDRKR